MFFKGYVKQLHVANEKKRGVPHKKIYQKETHKATFKVKREEKKLYLWLC